MWLGVDAGALGKRVSPSTPMISNYKDKLWVKGVKFFMDGALGSWGNTSCIYEFGLCVSVDCFAFCLDLLLRKMFKIVGWCRSGHAGALLRPTRPKGPE